MSKAIKIISLILIINVGASIDITANDYKFGSYAVGFKSYFTYDESRQYLLEEDTIPRPLQVYFWYPSQDGSGAKELNFKSYIDLLAQGDDFKRSKDQIDEHSFSFVKAYTNHAKRNYGLDTSISTQNFLDHPVHAVQGIPIPESSEFPLLIYVSSDGKASPQNHLLCEYLASHGFMIISVATARPFSSKGKDIESNALTQVADMEYLIKFCKDSMQIHYSKLGLFGFSSGGDAIAIYQMRNEHVDAILSMDGGQEYSSFLKLYKMKDFDLSKTDVPYCSLVNNYENYSIYPYYNSVITKEKYLFKMPHLTHNGFISYWQFFDACSSIRTKNDMIASFEILSECSLGFFSKYLKSEPSLFDSKYQKSTSTVYIQTVDLEQTLINGLNISLLNGNFRLAESIVEDNKELLFGDRSQVDLLGRICLSLRPDLAVWLYKKSVNVHPNAWSAHYGLGGAYKNTGDLILAKKELLMAKELNPEHEGIKKALNELESVNIPGEIQ